MKYCPSCKRIITDDADICDVCNKSTEGMDNGSAVTVTLIKGKAVPIVESALKDVGIPCSFEKTDGNVYNELNAKINAESDFRLLVPFELYGKAFDVCAGIGVVNPDDRLLSDDDKDSSRELQKTYEEKFEEVNGVKRSTWQMIWAVIFIVSACLLIWGVDWIAEFIKGLF